MSRRAQEVIDLLSHAGVDPTTTLHRISGRTTTVWHVDDDVDDDVDRYAEVMDSVSGGDFLCTVRDHRRAAADVLAEVGEVVNWARVTLVQLAEPRRTVASREQDQHVAGGG